MNKDAFPLPLRLERVAPMRAALIAPFRYVSDRLGRVIEVPAGFVTDYASVPRLFWSLYPPDGDYTPAAVVHDWLYSAQVDGEGEPITRAAADAVFLAALAACGVPFARRRLLYAAVRAGGAFAWRRARPADLPPLPPAPRRQIRRGPRAR